MVEHEKQINNSQLYDDIWDKWLDMKLYGPSSRWLRFLINKILKRIESKSIKHILDIGCGEGSNTFLLSRHFLNARVKGIDFSKIAIWNAQKRYKTSNLSFYHDMNSTSLNDQYDMITCFEVLEHVDCWKDLLQKMAVSSKKYLMLSFPTGKMRSFEKNVGHVRNFKKKEVETFLEALGFLPYKIYYAGFPFYSPFYRTLCNLTNSANNSFTMGKYGLLQKIVSSICYFYFTSLSTKKRFGDQFVGIFKKNSV